MKSMMLILYCFYLFFFSHLLVVPALAEYSYYGLLVVPFMLFMFWLIPAEDRKQAVVYTLLFLLMDQAMANAFNKMDLLPFVLSVVFIGLFLFPISWYFGKVGPKAFVVSLAVTLILNVALPNNLVQVLPYFYKKWNSQQLYIGEMSTHFPVIAKDLDQDGADELITIGNRDYLEKLVKSGTKRKPTYKITPEPLTVYVWKWSNGEMNRIPSKQVDIKQIKAVLPKEYIGFPYYVLNEKLELIPQTQRQALTEGMTQFGTAPYRALLLNLDNIEQQLKMSDGYYDYQEQVGTKFSKVALKQGILTGYYGQNSFEMASDATKIVGSLRLGNGEEGLILLGRDVHLLQWVNGKMTITHELTRKMQKGLALSQFQIIDLNQDGADELMIKQPFSTILQPQENGEWKILWSTDEKSFSFEDFRQLGNGHEFVGQSKSAVRAKDTLYLTGFKYTEQGMEQTWKIFYPVNSATFADLNGDGEQELITTARGQHIIYVLGQHSIPVTLILIGSTILLVLYLVGRRLRHAKLSA